MTVMTIGKNLNGIKIVNALARVSTTAQALVQHGSLEQQRNMFIRWCEQFSKEHGVQVKLEIFEEDISGREKSIHKRFGLHRIKKNMKQGRVDIFLIEKLDRLSRDQIENLKFMKLAMESKTDVYETESGRIDFKDRGSRMGFNLKNMQANEYSLDLEEKITKKQRSAMVNNGKDSSSYPVLGLDPHKTRRCMYVPNKDELKIVKSIMKKFVELQSYNDVVNFCKKRGFKTKERFTKEKADKEGNIIPPRKTGGEDFNSRTLKALLTNPKYRGKNVFEDDWNQFPDLQDEDGHVWWEYYHKREYGDIVSPSLIDQVDATIGKIQGKKPRTAKNNKVYFLSGMLKAPDGSSYYGSSAKGGLHRYYYCKATKRRYDCEDLEEKVIKRVKDYLGESGTLEKVIQGFLKNRLIGLPMMDDEIKKAKAQVTKLEKAVVGFSEKIRGAAGEDGDNWKDIFEMLMEEKNKTEGELEGLRSDLQAMEEKRHYVNTQLRPATVQDYFKKAMKHFDKKSDVQKKRIIQAIIPGAIIHPDHSLELRVNPDPNGNALLKKWTHESLPVNGQSGCDRNGNEKSIFSGNQVCHGGHNKVVLKEKWRERRDSNPRPSA